MRYNVKALSNETLAQVIRNAPEYAETLCCAAGLGGKLQDGVQLGALVHEAAEVLGWICRAPPTAVLLPKKMLRPHVSCGEQ